MICCMTSAAPDDQRALLERDLALIAQGSQDALADLYLRSRSAVYGFSLSLLKNPSDAEDVLQDTYLQIWRAAGAYRAQGKPMAWVLTITRNLSLSQLRERQRRDDSLPEHWIDQLADTPAVTQEDRMTLESLLLHLSEQERQIVILHALSGLKHREIAQLLELSLSTVLSKYHRALKKLRASWKEV